MPTPDSWHRQAARDLATERERYRPRKSCECCGKAGGHEAYCVHHPDVQRLLTGR